MQFRDLHRQYERLKPEMDAAIAGVLEDAHYISGPQVKALEESLAQYAGVKHCISCANGTTPGALARGTRYLYLTSPSFLPPNAPPVRARPPFLWMCGRIPSIWIPTVWSAAFRQCRSRAV